jgi:hypothetical protein
MSEKSPAATGGTSDLLLWTLAQNCTYGRDKLVNFGHISGNILRTLGFGASREFNESYRESCHQNSSKKVSLR